MAERPESGNRGENGGGIPRWAQLGVLIVAIVVLLVVAVMLVGGGHQSPIVH